MDMTIAETKLVVAKAAIKPGAKPLPKAAVSKTVNKIAPKATKTVPPKTSSNSEKTPSRVKTSKEKKSK